MRARAVLELCERFRCLPWPGSLLEQPAELLQLVKIAEMGTPREVGDGE